MTVLVLLALFGASPLAPPAAQEPPAPPPPWTAYLIHQREWPDGEAVQRSFTRLGLQRRLERGAVIGEVIHARAHDGGSVGVLGELYAPLWRNAEAYVSAGAAPGSRVLPEWQVGAEVVHHIGAGWHVGGAADQRHYDVLRTRRLLAVAGWQHGPWFVRARAGMLDAGEQMPTGHIIARRSLGDGRSHIEAVASAGGDVVDVAADAAGVRVTTTTGGRTLLLRGRFAFSPRYAMIAGAGVSRFGEFGRRTHLELGLSLSR